MLSSAPAIASVSATFGKSCEKLELGGRGKKRFLFMQNAPSKPRIGDAPLELQSGHESGCRAPIAETTASAAESARTRHWCIENGGNVCGDLGSRATVAVPKTYRFKL